MNLPELIESALTARRQYRELDKQSKELKDEFNRLKFEIIKSCTELGVDSTSIKGLATVTVTPKKHPSVKDWDELLRYMEKNDAYYLFQKRLNSSAYKEMLELEGVENLPGCETFEQDDLHISEL